MEGVATGVRRRLERETCDPSIAELREEELFEAGGSLRATLSSGVLVLNCREGGLDRATLSLVGWGGAAEREHERERRVGMGKRSFPPATPFVVVDEGSGVTKRRGRGLGVASLASSVESCSGGANMSETPLKLGVDGSSADWPPLGSRKSRRTPMKDGVGGGFAGWANRFLKPVNDGVLGPTSEPIGALRDGVDTLESRSGLLENGGTFSFPPPASDESLLSSSSSSSVVAAASSASL